MALSGVDKFIDGQINDLNNGETVTGLYESDVSLFKLIYYMNLHVQFVINTALSLYSYNIFVKSQTRSFSSISRKIISYY